MMVVNTDLTALLQCQQVLQQVGFVVTPVYAQEQVLALLQQPLFDMVLIDISSSPGDSLELLEKIRLHTIDVPVVIVTDGVISWNSPMFIQISQAVKVGIQGLLVKPLCPTELYTTIIEVLQRHQHEMTSRRNMIQQLVQTEKLAIAGRLVASLSHEMNNPLQALHNALNLLSKRTFNGRKRQQYQAMAQKEVENLIGIVRRMLDFYRPSVEGMRPTNLNSLLESVLQRVDHQLLEGNVQVLRDWSPRLPNVFAIASRIKQVCVDLINNAVQAMPNGGVLTIRTYTTNGTEYQINAGFEFMPWGAAGHAVRGPAVVLEISDTGIGIAPDELPKIVEPFYTTRFKATGLGLAISYSIVEQHRGELSVSSTEGQGTTVRVRLPAAT